jgi:hypothetical protein
MEFMSYDLAILAVEAKIQSFNRDMEDIGYPYRASFHIAGSWKCVEFFGNDYKIVHKYATRSPQDTWREFGENALRLMLRHIKGEV